MYKHRRGFLKILQRYINNTSAAEEKEAMDFWYDAIGEPDQEEKTEPARQALENKLWSRILTTIQEPSEQPEIVTRNWFERNLSRLALAASVVLITGLMYWMYGLRESPPQVLSNLSVAEQSALARIDNETSAAKQVRLPDGSQVVLEPNARLYYPASFNGKNRVVYLVGNGFFSVTHNAQKPFFVYCEHIVTKVLGTSFTIQKNEQSQAIEVAVRTGSVLVEAATGNGYGATKRSERVVLRPNEKVAFQQSTGSCRTGLVDNPQVVDTTDEFRKTDAFIFENTPLQEVLEKLEKAYGVEIKLTNTAIGECSVTANLADASLFAKLEIINALLTTKTEVQGTIIVMTGGECAPYKSAD